MLKLLVVTAHPDDEATFGGALLQAHERGAQTFVVCLTAGQAATHRGTATSDEELAYMRRREFQLSCEHLRVTESCVLDYPDGKLDRQDLWQVVGELTKIIRKIRPQVVLTYGPDGSVTAHPDHGMASLFTSAAFQFAPRSNRYRDQLFDGVRPYQPQKLYYTTSDFTLPERQPVSLPPATASIDISRYLQRKIEAFRKHTTQAPLFELFEEHTHQKGTKELYHLAALARTVKQVEIETDIWQGIEDLP